MVVRQSLIDGASQDFRIVVHSSLARTSENCRTARTRVVRACGNFCSDETTTPRSAVALSA
jgi:hypothetical protein